MCRTPRTTHAHPGGGGEALAKRDALTLAHLDLVRRVAQSIGRRLPPHVDRSDLVSVGMIGLLEAAARYRPSLGVPFEAFARRRVHGAIVDSLRGLDWIPRSLRALERKAVAAASHLRQELGREPSQDELAARLGMNPAAPVVGSALAEGTPGEPMQDLMFMLEQFPDPAESIETRMLRADLAAHVRHEVERLPARERRIIDGYYNEELTMAEIGADLGVCESRVSQLRSAAIAELRGTLAAKLGMPAVAGRPVVLTFRVEAAGRKRPAAASTPVVELQACQAA
ncbi:MAG TPA: sigma-70 family RNA polymerase sigma factor [Vicinamibacterales bacterium]|nr:sigma-70 family RNA polymerase sigma factor [Vicinamibacterales bacterium]